ncbi:MAG: hypothetical protein J7K31_01335 [Candidatus Aenigmarchaeota archaeon]|nr:hypothetical protein [Candidatus Aenigmarchaeota archaeon]
MKEGEAEKKRLLMRQRALLENQLSQKAAQDVAVHQQAVAELEALKKEVMLKILDKGARQRLSNLKVVKPDLAETLKIYLIQLYQTGQLRSRITEKELVQILSMMQKKKKFKIRRM